MTHFNALLLEKTEAGVRPVWSQLTESDLPDGDVTVRISHSTINYKDGLILTGRFPGVRLPIVPGIDFAGTVTASTHSGFKAGDRVILNGWRCGERHHGGYSEYARVSGNWLIKCPEAFSNAETMAIGTAGYTSMLSVLALEEHGLTPDKGPVLVTGAAGGVGSIAVAVLAKLGYRVIASTGRASEADYLKHLGATEIINREELAKPAPTLATERWAGAIDVAGSHTLANALAATNYGGTVAATGLAQGMDLPSSVAPFILRGVTLAGIESVMAPIGKREMAWTRLAGDLDEEKLAEMTTTRPLTDVVDLAPDILAGKVRGRVVFEVG